MRESPQSTGILTFGSFRLDTDRGCLLVDNEEIPLRPKTFALLSYLAHNPGRLVSKDELVRAVWRGAVVSDDVLTQSVGELRRAMGETGAAFIRTVPRRGYRFDAGVLPAAPVPTAPAPAGQSTPDARHRRWPLLVAILALLLAAAAGAWKLYGRGGDAAVTAQDSPQGSARTGPTIAVLPFENLGGDPRSQLFANGMTEYLTDALGRFSSLTVISPRALPPYRDAAAGSGEITPDLDVQYRIEGGVQLTAIRVHVNARLVDARGRLLWTRNYDDQPLAEVLPLQEELVQQISAALARQVADFELRHAAMARPGRMDAYDYLLQARSVMNDGRNGLAQARELLKRAIDLDPGYAAAHSTLALTYVLSVGMNWAESRTNALEKAQAAAWRALQRDQNDVLAHVVLGFAHLFSSQHDQALSEMKRALAINPNDSLALEGYGQILLWLGQPDAAIEALETARRIRPGMQGPQVLALALGYYLKGRYADAIVLMEGGQTPPPRPEVIADPLVDILLLLAACHAQLGHVDAATRYAGLARTAGPRLDIRTFGTWLHEAQDLQRLREGLARAGLDTMESAY